jgi:uncharacterized protein YbjT (DUF2867 family)
MKNVLLLGGSGFIGGVVAEALVKRGYFVTVPARQRERARPLLMLPTVDVVQADVRDPATLRELVKGQDAVINLVGILAGDFEAMHVELPKRLAEICVESGVSRLIQMSALHAEMTAPSQYLQSRARGEQAVWSVVKDHPGLAVTMFRPSVVYGASDNFLNMLRRLAGIFPVIPLGSSQAKFQPVWVEDVARAIVMALETHATIGQTYPLVGNKVYTLRELLDLVLKLTGHQRVVLELGEGLSNLQAMVFEIPPLKWIGAALGITLTRDNVKSMTVPNTSDVPFPAIFGHAASLEAIVSSYMQDSAGRLRYQAMRNAAGR